MENAPKVSSKNHEESKTLAQNLAILAEDRNCRNILILDLEGRSPIARHFVICTGTSATQIRNLAREAENLGEDHGFKVYGHAGFQEGKWAVIDFVDVIMHIFDDEFRAFYDLELLWGDAPRVPFASRKES